MDSRAFRDAGDELVSIEDDIRTGEFGIMKFKLFSGCDEATLQERVNRFLDEPIIEVVSTHFSTASSTEEVGDEGQQLQVVRYSVAIFYREL